MLLNKILIHRKLLIAILSASAVFVLYSYTSYNSKWTIHSENGAVVAGQITNTAEEIMTKCRNHQAAIFPGRKLDWNSVQLLDQTDKELWSYIRTNHVFPPSKLGYSFGKKRAQKADVQIDTIILQLFKKKKKGFFLEVGAFDGIYSHTLFLERYYKWTGILIECNPYLIPKLKSVHRKAYISDVCLSNSSRPGIATMTSMDSWLASSSLGGGDIFPHHIQSNFTTIQVQTMPLYAIIAAINVTQIDLIILDIQSMELFVIRAFPFHLVHVKVWVIETVLFAQSQKDELVTIMRNNGYSKPLKLDYDIIFVHDSMNISEMGYRKR